MDFKAKLGEMVAEESQEIAAQSHRKELFAGEQRRAFEAIRLPLLEIVETAGPAIIKFYLGESYADVRFGEPGSIETTYDIQPNSVGRFSSSPSSAPGFLVRTKTTYDYGFKYGLGYIEPTEREYILPTSEALLDDLMKGLAKAISKNEQKQRE